MNNKHLVILCVIISLISLFLLAGCAKKAAVPAVPEAAPASAVPAAQNSVAVCLANCDSASDEAAMVICKAKCCAGNDTCIMNEAQSKQSFELCRRIDDSTLRSKCVVDIAVEIESVGACAIADEWGDTKASKNCIKDIAVKTHNLAGCDVIYDDEMANSCREAMK